MRAIKMKRNRVRLRVCTKRRIQGKAEKEKVFLFSISGKFVIYTSEAITQKWLRSNPYALA